VAYYPRVDERAVRIPAEVRGEGRPGSTRYSSATPPRRRSVSPPFICETHRHRSENVPSELEGLNLVVFLWQEATEDTQVTLIPE
jgi:hypothetical protein